MEVALSALTKSSNILPVVCIFLVLLFFVYYWCAMAPRKGTLEWMAKDSRGPMSFSLRRHPMTGRDVLPLLLVTAVYAAVAFFNLGDMTAPQSGYSFTQNDMLEFQLEEETELSKLMYYTGLGTGEYIVSYSTDGESWAELPKIEQKHNTLFKWIELYPEDTETITVRYLRVTATAVTSRHTDLELKELALYDGDGKLIDAAGVVSKLLARDDDAGYAALVLFDEQDTIPAYPYWTNSTYFDEIYHARTALELIEGDYPYEVAHPPLAKIILGLGIRLFGMTPFGWRFTGTLFGVLMLPMLYVFLKNLFGKTALCVCGTLLFAFDFMHFTQTRIATIDTYGVIFILGMYFFLYRWLTAPPPEPVEAVGDDCSKIGWKAGGNLFLAGLCFGLGAACKWTVVYAACGAALLYCFYLYYRWRDWPCSVGYAKWLVKTILLSVLFFVMIPMCIYTASYFPYAKAAGDATLWGTITQMWDSQVFMLTYHEGATEFHPYTSRWYQWLVDARPILYYLNTELGEGVKSAFAAFNNPWVSWCGLLCVVITAIQAVRKHCGKALFLVVGFLSQLLPWMPIVRTTFAYHYFPSTLFLVLCICWVMNDLMERRAPYWRWAVYGGTGVSLTLFVLFYPVLMGLAVPVWYTTDVLRWFPSWPF